MTRLSPHFTLAELRGETAPPLSRAALEALARTLLEPVRLRFGPVIVTSGYRDPGRNARAGGKATSQHLRGQAADFHVPGVPCWEVWRWIGWDSGLPFGQCILESGNGGAPWTWVHLSLGAPWRAAERSGQRLTRTGPDSYQPWTTRPETEPA